jgi:hypothetical protein
MCYLFYTNILIFSDIRKYFQSFISAKASALTLHFEIGGWNTVTGFAFHLQYSCLAA